MKVAQINAYDCGSTGKIMLGIAEVARCKGIDAYTFSSSRAAKNQGAVKHEYFDRYTDYRIHMGMGMIFGFETDFSYIATKRLLKRLKEIKPDIIHIHNTHGWYLNHPLLFNYIKKNKIKTVWTLHDCWTFTGRCPHFQLTGCDRWRNECHNCLYDKKMYPASYFFDRSRAQHKKKKKMFLGIKDLTLVTPSKWLANLVEESYLKDYPIKVINNGIDLDIFKPTESNFREKYKLQDKKIVLGVASSWGERKGLDVFTELAKRLNEDYQIVLVGTNDNIDKQLPKNIISIHRTNNQKELAEIYSAADVFANPTREDNFPTVNIEALACGTPIITFRTGGSPEIIDETCGSVVECNDIKAFEKEVKRVCEEKPYSKEACLKRAKLYDMEEKFKEYVELYEEKADGEK